MNNPANTQFGEEMRLIRVHLNWSIKEMAQRLGIVPATLSNYERGRVPPVDIYMKVLEFKKDIKQTLNV